MKKYFPTLWFVLRIVAGIVAALVVLALLASVVLDIYGHRKLKAARKQAADKGVALSMKELLAKRRPIPETSNAANYYEAAFSVLKAKGNYIPDGLLSPFIDTRMRLWLERLTPQPGANISHWHRTMSDYRYSLPRYLLAAMEDYVGERRHAVDLVCKAAALPDCAYHVDWSKGPLDAPYLDELFQANRLMFLAACLDAEKNRPSDAVAKFRANLALASSLAGEPDYHCSIAARRFVASLAIDGLTRIVSRTDVSGEDLRLLQRDLERFVASTPLRNAIEAELASYCDSCVFFASGKSRTVPPLSDFPLPGALPPPSLAVNAGPVLAWLFRGAIKMDQAAAIKCCLAFLDNPGAPSAAARKAMLEVAGIIGKDRLVRIAQKQATARAAGATVEDSFFMSAAMYWSLKDRLARGDSLSLRAGAAAAALAALRFKNDTGHWPENLAALVPAYLDKVPLDSTGNPLVYTVLPDGIAVYSVGSNGRDDGGKPSPLAPVPQDPKYFSYDDFGFCLYK